MRWGAINAAVFEYGMGAWQRLSIANGIYTLPKSLVAIA
jgi:hypothetical protein